VRAWARDGQSATAATALCGSRTENAFRAEVIDDASES
jgi:hypothetical protein